MGCLGLHFSLDSDQVAALTAVPEDQRVEFVQERFEEELWSADRSRAQETDKAWDAIHRSLTDGALAWRNGSYPLNHTILAGKLLYRGSDYILSLKSPQQVRDIAGALRGITRDRLRRGYERIDSGEYGYPLEDEDFEYTWRWFEKLVDFYCRAASAGHAVLFTADQ